VAHLMGSALKYAEHPVEISVLGVSSARGLEDGERGALLAFVVQPADLLKRGPKIIALGRAGSGDG